MRKAFLYRADVSRSTEQRALHWLYLCRTLYNACLEQRIDAWQRRRKSLGWFEQKRELVQLKAEFPEYKNVGSQVLQNVTWRIDLAFQAFFKRLKRGEKPGFPRFKGRDRYDSFTFPNHQMWKLEGRNFIIRNVGRFKLFLDRPIEGDIKTVTVRRASTGKWFVSFSCENVPERILEPCDKKIGLDVGLKVFLADSDGNFIENPRFFQSAQKNLRVKQRSLSRKIKGSNRRKKAKLQVAKAYEKTKNQRQDFVNKTALKYLQENGTIYVEDLNIGDLLKNKNLAKSIADASWSAFIQRLIVAAGEAQRSVVKVDPRNTSQTCLCGELVPKSLAVRVHKCHACGLVMDRDVLAAKNILRFGQGP